MGNLATCFDLDMIYPIRNIVIYRLASGQLGSCGGESFLMGRESLVINLYEP
uniref:Uncharacterized protein n=1 Tax=Picea glauca TaxID=3330 RepID=A0A124GP94_PICGL|nr:hypothetical protein ABT39_MTgene1110 [Picea glauca]QHR87773.1 hypothetical protein Q903MT_gene1785 [Picea sitchensis]